MKEQATFNQALMGFIDSSPSPFHAVAKASDMLEKSGFKKLDLKDSWDLQEGDSYFLAPNGSSLIAFNYANKNWAENACRMMGAHTDSPCLKLKPKPAVLSKGYLKLGVEVYGGALLKPWFDRDLSLAGRVSAKDQTGGIVECLVDFKKPLAFIPSLAIHLDREANQKSSVNPQKDLLPVLMRVNKEENIEEKFSDILLTELKKFDPQITDVSDFELCFYDTQKGSYVGFAEEFIASARLDNLLSCFVGLQALIDARQGGEFENSLIVLNDHEEVGSQSAIGAQGVLLKTIMERICQSIEKSSQCLSQSLLISADNAHGIHPNFPDKHDQNHGPIINEGPVLKINSNQRYASNSITSAFFRRLCEDQGVNLQTFVVRTDMACGSTIGPISAAALGVPTVDVGVPTFAMHSIRESAGSDDAFSLYKVVLSFFNTEKILN